MCTYKYLTHYDALYIVFNFTFTTAFYSLSWLAWVSVRLRGWQQSESRVTPHNVINTKQMGERKQLLGKMSVPAFHCNGFTAIIFAGVFGLSVAKSASYRQQSTKNFFFHSRLNERPYTSLSLCRLDEVKQCFTTLSLCGGRIRAYFLVVK